MAPRLSSMLFALLPLLMGADRAPVAVGVRNVTTTLSGTDPEFLVLLVRFDAVVHYDRALDLRIAKEPVVLYRVDRFRDQQGWQPMLTSTWYPASGENVYRTCAPGPKREDDEFVLPGVEADAILRRTDKDSHAQVVVRFYMWTACKDGEKTIVRQLVTEPVELKIPKWGEGKTERPAQGK